MCQNWYKLLTAVNTAVDILERQLTGGDGLDLKLWDGNPWWQQFSMLDCTILQIRKKAYPKGQQEQV